MRFLNRIDTADSIIFEVENIIYRHSWNCITPWKPMNYDNYYTTAETIALPKSNFNFLTKASPLAVTNSDVYVSNWQPSPLQEGYYVPVNTSKSEFGYEITFGPLSLNTGQCRYYKDPEESENPHLVVRGYSADEGMFSGIFNCSTDDITFGQGRGIIHTLRDDNFESGEEYIQIGTLIQGDTTGVVPSDATILQTKEIPDIQVSVFPNPASESFSVYANTNIQSIELWDTLGKLVLGTNPTSQNAEVDAKNLLAGVYVVRVKTSDGIRVLRIVIE